MQGAGPGDRLTTASDSSISPMVPIAKMEVELVNAFPLFQVSKVN